MNINRKIYCALLLSTMLIACSRTQPVESPRAQSVENQTDPFIVEWLAADRGALESLLRKTAVAVEISANQPMKPIQECRMLSTEGVPTGYVYETVTPKHTQVKMRDTNDLYQNIPVGAARFENILKEKKQLNIDTMIVGRYELTTPTDSLRPESSNSSCARATHIIRALTVGAFTFSAGEEDDQMKADDSSNPTRHKHAREVLNQDGDVRVCEKAKLDDQKPPARCGALIRIELAKLSKKQRHYSEKVSSGVTPM